MFVFRKIWRALFSWNTRFEIRPFTLLPSNCEFVVIQNHTHRHIRRQRHTPIFCTCISTFWDNVLTHSLLGHVVKLWPKEYRKELKKNLNGENYKICFKLFYRSQICNLLLSKIEHGKHQKHSYYDTSVYRTRNYKILFWALKRFQNWKMLFCNSDFLLLLFTLF